jgi:hypothetical protein
LLNNRRPLSQGGQAFTDEVLNEWLQAGVGCRGRAVVQLKGPA